MAVAYFSFKQFSLIDSGQSPCISWVNT